MSNLDFKGPCPVPGGRGTCRGQAEPDPEHERARCRPQQDQDPRQLRGSGPVGLQEPVLRLQRKPLPVEVALRSEGVGEQVDGLLGVFLTQTIPRPFQPPGASQIPLQAPPFPKPERESPSQVIVAKGFK